MPNLNVVLAGGSGFLGTHLRAALTERGHQVTSLVRREPTSDGQARWDPYAGEVPQELIDAADVVINLAGSPTLGNPHSRKWARELRESRISTTTVLAEAIARSTRPGGLPAFLAGNGIAYYGDHGDAVLTEASDTRGHALLTQVCREWQQATSVAADAGSRVCILRTSPVMDVRSAPLKPLRLLTRLGLGTRLGNGRQYMTMISLRDWVGAVVHLAEHPAASGPFNLGAPRTPTNKEFTQALAAALHRPAVLVAPSPFLKVAAGEMSSEVLGSLNVRPAALEKYGYTFLDPDVEAILATGLAG